MGHQAQTDATQNIQNIRLGIHHKPIQPQSNTLRIPVQEKMGDRDHLQTIQSLPNQNHQHKLHNKILPLPIQNTLIRPMEIPQHNNKHDNNIKRIHIQNLPSRTKHKLHNNLQTRNPSSHKHTAPHRIKKNYSNHLKQQPTNLPAVKTESYKKNRITTTSK